ncbi:hypothetical protein [Luteimonas sp. R10]|uniref:hypothetical protein n=1 Tax=Luteimonas sp. R10 TaxID=3108176 RepID=UPI003086A7D4|nr:hypothetical protein U3649_10910 [Luteimonas sp. R10]
MRRWLLVLLFALLPGLAPAGDGDAPLRFRVAEGDVLNAFHRQGPIAAHLLLGSGRQPRLLAAFPAGNSGVGVWFEATAAPVRWTLGEVEGIQRPDASGRLLHGIAAQASVDADRLVVRDAVLGSVRVLRDFQLGTAYPAAVATPARVSAHGVTWARARIDGAPGYAISLELLDGRVDGGDGTPLVLVPAREGEPLRLRITALTGEQPLVPIAAEDLFGADASRDPRSRQALQFLSYREKFLAGSWRFNTYFGRDTLMSLRLLLPGLQPAAIEDGLASVLERLDAQGEVAHEEDIGEFALLRRRKPGAPGDPADDSPIYDYTMVDDDLMLAPVAAAYLLDRPPGRARAAAFLARTTTAGEPLGAALARNFDFVLRSAQAFSRQPVARNLVSLKPGSRVGQWRDSQDGLAGGRYPYDVNAVFMPAALDAIARFEQAGLLRPHATPEQRRAYSTARDQAIVWSRRAPPLFRTALTAAAAREAIVRHAKAQGIDPAPALDSLPRTGLRFDALALDARGRPIPVLHSDGGFALLFLAPEAEALETMVDNMLRPFPAGLLTGAGLLVANPAYADTGIVGKFGRTAYHGTVVWSWQQALLAAGLTRQLHRHDLPAATRTRLREAQRRLWRVIDATRAMRTSELWSWSYVDGRYRAQPFGQGSGDADESNAAQLWSTVYLAIPPPAPEGARRGPEPRRSDPPTVSARP